MSRNIKYRATGGVDYVFDFVPLANTWRAYIVSQPPYRGRATGAHETHRLNDGRPYICWDRAIATESEMRQVAALWAEATQHYIVTGVFQPPANRPPVRDRTPAAPAMPAMRRPRLAATPPTPRGLRRIFAR